MKLLQKKLPKLIDSFNFLGHLIVIKSCTPAELVYRSDDRANIVKFLIKVCLRSRPLLVLRHPFQVQNKNPYLS